MSLLQEAIVAEKYGLRLTVDQLSYALSIAKNTIYNQVAQGVFKIPTYLDGKCRYADYRDVARYLDEVRASAATQV